MKRLIHLLLITALFFTSTVAQITSKYIVTDQFGFLPDEQKKAIIRDPQIGYDADESYLPGESFAVVNAITKQIVFSGGIQLWNGGNTDPSSGDKVWYFDFTEVDNNGLYYILDETNNTRSYTFEISPAVYKNVLKHAMRTFFYQRVGYAKEVPYADERWADGASHIGPLQDTGCRIFNDRDNPATEKDLSGGWYDAGDYNKYTSWNANYVVEFMKAYIEKPDAWGDDYNIPESGNGIPDILDEAKWGIDHLLRMQLEDGSVLSIVGEAGGSPPSSATGQSLYGSPNTSGTLNTCGAFAIASKVYRETGMTDYADTLLDRSIKAWNWAEANPSVLFRNNDNSYNSGGLGAGQQETDDYGRLTAKLEAAVFLFEVTGDSKYRDFFF